MHRLDYEAEMKSILDAVETASRKYDSPKRSARVLFRAATELAIDAVLKEGPPLVVLCTHGLESGLALETNGADHGRIAPLRRAVLTERDSPMRSIVHGIDQEKAPAILLLGACQSLQAAH